MKEPEGERLDDLNELMLDHSWRCPGGMPQWTLEQLSEWASVAESWFRVEFAPRKVSVSKEYRKPGPKPRPKAARVASALSSSTIPAVIRKDVLRRDCWECQRCGRPVYGIRPAIQHRRPRGMGGSKLLHTMANLVLLCGWADDPDTCTHWVERQDRPGATRDGWLVPMGMTPEEWPVLRFDRSWEMPGDVWVPAVPHSMQIELGAVA